MAKLTTYSKEEISNKIHIRAGEQKLGQTMRFINLSDNWQETLRKDNSKFVIFGVPEDIGIRANFGRPGSASAWKSFLNTFVNIQHNQRCQGNQITILGELDTTLEMDQAQQLDPHNEKDREKLFEMVSQIDDMVTAIVKEIISQNKTPIIIGGGHNNAYGNLKGLSLAKNKSINAINFDAHTDFRPLVEGRHSGNVFSYAMKEGFLDNYFIFGLHEDYLSHTVEESINRNANKVKFNTYEEIAVRRELIFEEQLFLASSHIEDKPFGLEIDLDSIPMMGSSAMTPSGFSTEHLRHFVHYFGQKPNAAYLHICEGAPELLSSKNPNLVGKLITYLVTDFIKSTNHQNV